MLMDITSIDLFDQNVGMACANVRLRCLLILLALIYLINIWVWHVPIQMFINITSIDLFDRNRDVACPNVRLRYS